MAALETVSTEQGAPQERIPCWKDLIRQDDRGFLKAVMREGVASN